MFSLQAWTLLLSATASSALTLPGSRSSQAASICNDLLDTFSSEACHQEATGMSKTALSARAANDWRDVVVGSSCTKTFFVYSPDEFEFFWPEFKNCSISTYGAVVAATVLQDVPCRTRVKADADFIVLPPYLANDCYWPALHEGCSGATNLHRSGEKCEVRAMQQALAIHNDTGKTVLLVDKDAVLSDEVYEVLGHTGIIFAKVGAGVGHFREGFDVSMPPAAPLASYQTPPEALDGPISGKAYFAAFKGNLSTPGGELVRSFVSGRGDCLVVEEADPSADDDAVFRGSKFVLMTDPESYHFPEAVCGGGVPVMIADAWAPPFDEFVRFGTYGVHLELGTASADAVAAALGRFSDGELEGMRGRAGEACRGFFQTTELQVQKLMEGVLHRPGASNATADELDGRHYTTSMNPVAVEQ